MTYKDENMHGGQEWPHGTLMKSLSQSTLESPRSESILYKLIYFIYANFSRVLASFITSHNILLMLWIIVNPALSGILKITMCWTSHHKLSHLGAVGSRVAPLHQKHGLQWRRGGQGLVSSPPQCSMENAAPAGEWGETRGSCGTGCCTRLWQTK